MAVIPFVVAAFAAYSLARDISFPPVKQILGAIDNDLTPGLSADISQARYAGLTTYANLPYVHCLSADEKVEPFNIPILGDPFDTGVNARSGARFGPLGIREGSRRIAPEFSYSVYAGQNPFAQGFKIVDCGNAPLTVLDNTLALRQLNKAHKVVSARGTNSSEYTAPRIITLGGYHTTPLPTLRSTFKIFGALSVIH